MSRESRGGEAVPAEEKEKRTGGDSAGRRGSSEACGGDGVVFYGEGKERKNGGANGKGVAVEPQGGLFIEAGEIVGADFPRHDRGN